MGEGCDLKGKIYLAEKLATLTDVFGPRTVATLDNHDVT